MPPKRGTALTNDDKLAFLMACIKNSSTKLTIDFEAVKDDVPGCGTKDAAYWRHFRLMKEYGMSVSGHPYGSGKNGSKTATTKKLSSADPKAPKSTSRSKKRTKAEMDSDDNDEDAVQKQVKEELNKAERDRAIRIKNEPGEQPIIKDEDDIASGGLNAFANAFTGNELDFDSV